jgi:hypothetical protein
VKSADLSVIDIEPSKRGTWANGSFTDDRIVGVECDGSCGSEAEKSL